MISAFPSGNRSHGPRASRRAGASPVALTGSVFVAPRIWAWTERGFLARVACGERHRCWRIVSPRRAAFRPAFYGVPVEIFITHKPRDMALTTLKVAAALTTYQPEMLEHGQVFEF